MTKTTAGIDLLFEVNKALNNYGMTNLNVERVKFGNGVNLTWSAFESFAEDNIIDMSALDRLMIEGDDWIIEHSNVGGSGGWRMSFVRPVEEREE